MVMQKLMLMKGRLDPTNSTATHGAIKRIVAAGKKQINEGEEVQEITSWLLPISDPPVDERKPRRQNRNNIRSTKELELESKPTEE